MGTPLTKKFLSNYKIDYSFRLRRKKEDERLAKKKKDELIQEIDVIFSEQLKFINTLIAYRKLKEYEIKKREGYEAIDELRESLDYPKLINLDVDKFFSITKLGNIMSFPKPTIKREINKFRKLIFMLCDEEKDISVRYNLALKGDFKIRGVNEALISKILVIHKPDLYFVKNKKSKLALKKYGIEFPRGISKGDKYKITCKILKKVCIETHIENFAVLDNYLFIEGSK